MSNYEAQAQLLWESVLDMMAPLCAKDDMTVLRSLALRAQGAFEQGEGCLFRGRRCGRHCGWWRDGGR